MDHDETRVLENKLYWSHLGELGRMASDLVVEMMEKRVRTKPERFSLALRVRMTLSEFVRRSRGSPYEAHAPERSAHSNFDMSGFIEQYETDSRNYRKWLIDRAIDYVRRDLGIPEGDPLPFEPSFRKRRWQEDTHQHLKADLNELAQCWREAGGPKYAHEPWRHKAR